MGWRKYQSVHAIIIYYVLHVIIIAMVWMGASASSSDKTPLLALGTFDSDMTSDRLMSSLFPFWAEVRLSPVLLHI